ncbi:unnamed protein product [Cylindrotheca closterium]|uniref:MOSC domain-containing protein n=1 Tax=Cylindrotheca closterium TaxID=2856 RepID=A0AAD2CMR8_9STRA|nr:unnamed protein product [Cylindrotheca closterium]
MQVTNKTCVSNVPFGGDRIQMSSLFQKIDTLTIFIFGSIMCLVSTLILRRKKSPFERSVDSMTKGKARFNRKRAFLSNVGDEYGYRHSGKGYIDDWRHKEFPTLQPPLGQRSTDAIEEREIYLDYAGSALPSKSQMEASFQSLSSNVLANPHSSGPAASRTLLGIQQSKTRILNHFDATAGRFASIQRTQDSALTSDSHSGYDVVFTSGTTEALRVVAERFPWQTSDGQQSILLYAQNSHSSVLGMREVAISLGARLMCLPIEEIESMTKESFAQLRNSTNNGANDSSTIENYGTNCLLVFPAECNFGGHKPNSQKVIETAQSAGWHIMLDIAKAASTGPVSLRDLNPDFACVSFYKLFGSPTGVGSLFVKRTAVDLLSESKQHRPYVGGGSFNLILANQDMSAPSSGVSSLVSGTPNFRGIIELRHGFDEIERLGGMEKIQQHTSILAKELHGRLSAMHHGNGKPVAITYGVWSINGSSNGEDKGPTIAMNILRDDGSFVGYNEVAKLAALRKPAIQFRTGCFCNPGACQEALKLGDEELIQNYKESGHVCGDHIDILNDKPTGAIRISFGKESIWEDLDEFVAFIDQTFVNKNKTVADETIATLVEEDQHCPPEVTLTELYIFPIKSCAAQRVSHWKMDIQSGKLAHDREFALVDSAGVAMRLQNNPKMGFITPHINGDDEILTVSAPGCEDLIIPLAEINSSFLGSNDISVCGNKCGGRLCGGRRASEWFSSYLGVECWLARYSKANKQTNGEPNTVDDSKSRMGFANDQPILMISENAVDALNQVLRHQNQALVGSKHFRPNMVIRWKDQQNVHKAHLEDDWTKLYRKDNGLIFNVKGDCARCAMVDYDPSTGKKGKTLRALAKYRRRNGQIVFGVFLKAMLREEQLANEQVWIHVGDQLVCEY